MNRQAPVRAVAVVSLSLLAAALAAGPAAAQKILTGTETSIYHTALCPLLQKQLAKSQLAFSCAPSPGSVATLRGIAAEPRDIGYAQLDVLALEVEKSGAKDQFAVIRSDDTRECLFLTSRNKQFTVFGDVQAYAHTLRFILPPKDSDAAATFAFLQKVDADGLGKAKSVTYAASAEDAVRQALSAEDTLALFVQVPDPSTSIFKVINDGQGQMIPVIDRAILRQQVGGQKVYFAEETEVVQARWVKSGKKVVTACTPVALVTGDPARISDEKGRQDQRDVIATIQKLKPSEVVPRQSIVQRLLKKTRELSALSTEKLMDVSEKARVAAGPALEKAKEATEKAYEKAKEATKDAMDKAKEAIGKDEERKDAAPSTPTPSTPDAPPKG